jgi:hypothetical protein
MNVSGLTFTRASCHANRRPRITIISRVESFARCGFTLRSWNRASCFTQERFSAASARRDRENEYEEMDEIARYGRYLVRLCVNGRKMERGMNVQLYTLRDST